MKHADIYNDIMARIQATIPEIEYIDWFNEQLLHLDEDENELPFQLPAVMIQFPNSASATHGIKKQLDTVEVRLLLITETLEEPNSLEDVVVRDRSLDEGRIAQLLVNSLLGYNTANFGSLSHTGTVPDHDFTGIKGTWVNLRTVARNLEAIAETVEHEASVKIVQGDCK